MDIRKAELDDQGDIVACVTEAYQPYLERMGTEPAPMLDDYAALIERGVVYVGIDGGVLVGLIVMWPKDDHLYIDNIAVHPSAHGTGAGSQLIEHAAQLAREQDKPTIRLYTNEAMVENLDYYPRRGFVETHRGVEAGYQRVYFSRPVR